MKVCILGWYGTETIGDRAILVGIYSFLSKIHNEFEVYLGSLYPFYSERMLREDMPLYKEVLNKDIKINIFNSKNKGELDENIKQCDWVIMGGGPIMHINELFIIEYSFKKAKSLGIKTALVGCGIGPLFNKKHKIAALDLVELSDKVILRDEKSKYNLMQIAKECNRNILKNKIKTSFDPAVECAIQYKNIINTISSDKEIVVNLREFPDEYTTDNNKNSIDDKLEDMIIKLSNKYKDNTIRLVPMHYFYIGNDDRCFLNKIKIRNKLDNVIVQNKILTLKETMDVFYNAKFNIGMRFHSVVLQTILKGKNYILDYTEPNKGKISGFISSIDKNGFFTDKTILLQEDHNINIDLFMEIENRFNYDEDEIRKKREIYINELKELGV